MKQFASYVFTVFLATGVIALTGCEEAGHEPGHDHSGHFHLEAEGEHPHTTPTGLVLEEPVEVTDEMLLEIDDYLSLLAYGLIDLSNNADFIEVLKTEIEKQFDEDDNVLFRDLTTACSEADIDLESAMSASILAHAPADIRELVGDLADVMDNINYDGEGFYPQIYFPFAEDVDITTAPTAILPLTSDVYEVSDQGTGFQPTLDPASGEVTGFSSVTVTEDDAADNLVWVVSINERVNYLGTLDLVYKKNSNKTSCPPTKWFEFYPRMKIKDKKESGFSGKVEVYFGFVQYDSFNPTSPTRWTEEQKIKRIRAKNYDDPFDLHLEFTTDWSWCDEKIALIIYERDKPAKRKTWQYESTTAMQFQSKQGEYWKGYFHENDYYSTGPWQGVQTNHTNSAIDFSMRGR